MQRRPVRRLARQSPSQAGGPRHTSPEILAEDFLNTVAIFGVGLIGGSFALALRQAGFRGTILGVSSAATLERAIQLGVVDQAASAEDASQQADLIFLAQPIFRILEIISVLDSLVSPYALVTDAGSTKVQIVQAAAGSITRCQFLGGHPMAGKESRGVESAEASLFVGRPWVFTPTSPADLDTGAARSLIDWVRRLGAVPLFASPQVHDRTVAYTSHLPQLLSTMLAGLLPKQGPETSQFFGPGLIDMTRLAMSSFDLWADILATNVTEIDSALSAYIAALAELRSNLRSGDIATQFDEATAFAAHLRRLP